MKSNDRNSPLWKFGFSFWLGLQLAAQSLSAQTASNSGPSAPGTPPDPAGLQVMLDALKARSAIVDVVASGSATAGAGLLQLKDLKTPSGVQIDPDADFAFGAIDVGRRLLVLKKPTEAEAFFQAADTALTRVIERTPDSSASDKVQYLKARADIRAKFLNRLSDARADFDSALKLSPADLHLQQLRRLLPADPAATLQNHQGLPTKG
jgi:hypothetical protein